MLWVTTMTFESVPRYVVFCDPWSRKCRAAISMYHAIVTQIAKLGTELFVQVAPTALVSARRSPMRLRPNRGF